MIKTARLINVQCHVDTTYEFPETGIVSIVGENGHGKSVLFKMLKKTLRCSFNNLDERKVMINKYTGTTYCELYLESYEGSKLIIHIDREVSKSYYELLPDNLRLDVRDEKLPDLISSFGFHMCKDISLNLYNTYDPLFFINTPSKLNYQLLQSCRTDNYAEALIEKLTQLKDELKYKVKEIEGNLQNSILHLSMLPNYDLEIESKIVKLKLSVLPYINLINILPNLSELYLNPITDIECFPSYNIDLSIQSFSIPDFNNNLEDIIIITIPEIPCYPLTLDIVSDVFNVSTQIDLLIKSIKEPNESHTISYPSKIDFDVSKLIELNNNMVSVIQDNKCPVCERSLSIEL